MATLVLGTVGRVFGGPIGGIVGTALGGFADQGLFGTGPRSNAGRASSLAVQSAAYGEPIAVVGGRMRAAGNLIWTSGIKESSGAGGKGGQGASGYSYAASFAVGLAGRPIIGVGRIWADGVLIRDAAGMFAAPITMRLYRGDEGQAVDPLIAAAEGAAGAPAYRGLAYVVFEDLALADYGNRIPNLSFEIIADDEAGYDLGRMIAALAFSEGRSIAAVDGTFPAIHGYFAGRAGSIADAVAPLFDVAGAAMLGDGLTISGDGDDVRVIALDELDAASPGDSRGPERRRRLGGDTRTGVVELAYYDIDRDYQPGLQRARRDALGAIDQQAIAASMAADAAKSLATRLLARSFATRLQATVRLPWRHLGIRAGMRVQMAGDATVWRVRQARFENFVVNLDLERIDTTPAVATRADAGRVQAFAAEAAGPTQLAVLDLPPLPGILLAAPRLWIAAAGASPGWRRATIEASADGGATYTVVGTAASAVPLGVARSRLPTGSDAGWDPFGTVDVELLSDTMWLEPRSDASLLAGGNLALLGDEIIQFGAVDMLGPRCFRLSRLLRGRRGTEAAIAGHAVGERFIALDPASLLSFDPALDALGQAIRMRPAGSGDLETPPTEATVLGRSLMPLSPVHLRLKMIDGRIVATWVRRSRAGFGWPDFVDAPLAEDTEAYQVAVSTAGRIVRTAVVATPAFTCSAAECGIDGSGGVVTLTVAQLSAVTGPGPSAETTLIVP